MSDDAGDTVITAPGGDRHAERVEDQVGAHVVGHRVAQQPPRPEVEDRRQVQPAFPRRDVGDVLAPRRIGSTGPEAASDEIGNHVAVGARERGAARAATEPARHAVLAHQAPHLLLVDDEPGFAQRLVHARYPVVVVGLVEQCTHQLHELGFRELALGRPGRFAVAPVVVARRGHASRFARCGHREPGRLLVIDTTEAGHGVDVSFTQKATDRLSRSRSIRSCAFSAQLGKVGPFIDGEPVAFTALDALLADPVPQRGLGSVVVGLILAYAGILAGRLTPARRSEAAR